MTSPSDLYGGFRILIPWLVTAIVGVLGWLVFVVYRGYAVSLFLAVIIYILFRKPHKWLLYKLGERFRTLTASLSTLIVSVVLIAPAFYLLFLFLQEANTAINWAVNWLTRENILALYHQNLWLEKFLPVDEEQILHSLESFRKSSSEIGLLTLQFGGNVFTGILKIVSNFLLSLFILFFLFLGADTIGPAIYRVLPFPDHLENRIGDRMVAILDAVIKGNLWVSLLQGLLLGIYLWLFSVPTPILYGSIGSFFALIPIVGTSVVSVPAGIWLHLQGHQEAGIALVIVAHTTYLVLENVIKPMILDKTLNLHPMFLFLALLGGLSEFGVKGLILGPFFVTLFTTVWQVLDVWRNIEVDGESPGNGSHGPES